ncbi:MAG: hypothetical protein DDT28_01180 [Dehalococcoidia bacterium]|nr:hypothetical protein [Chloroflexota bacterium]MBT9159180.1 hypothetical protein [Chloroflexota bacterium]
MRKNLEIAKVGGSDDQCSLRQEVKQDRPRQSGSLVGVGTGSQFIQEHQAPPGRGLNDAHHIADVPTESGEGLLDALFITDIGENVVEDRDAALLRSGNGHARLSHQG